jgi:hypothetical protein
MSSEIELELSRQYRTAQDKYIYFLLAAAASAIGYAITQIKVEPLATHHIFVGIAVLLWSVSFYSGIQICEYLITQIFQNHNYIAFKRDLKGTDPETATLLLSKFKETFHCTIEKQDKRKLVYSKLQSICLLLGALFYIFWHILKMIAASA